MVKDDGDESVLQEAQRLTHGPRNADYGHPLDDYTRTANLINSLFSHKLCEPFDAEDAAQVQVLVKMSRHQNVRKRDNMVDAAGYSWVTWACTEERTRRVNEAPKVEDYAGRASSYIDRAYSEAAKALDSVSDDATWRAAELAHDPGEGAPTVQEWALANAIAPVGTGPLEPKWPDNAGAGAPVTPKGRLLPCGCFGTCTYIDGPHPLKMKVNYDWSKRNMDAPDIGSPDDTRGAGTVPSTRS